MKVEVTLKKAMGSPRMPDRRGHIFSLCGVSLSGTKKDPHVTELSNVRMSRGKIRPAGGSPLERASKARQVR